MINKMLCLLMAILWSPGVQGQGVVVVSGVVSQGDLIPLVGATVVLNGGEGGTKRIAITNTDKKGAYRFEIPGTGNYELRYSAVGFESRVIQLAIDSTDKGNLRIIDVVLQHSMHVLEEVFIEIDRSALRRRDTVVFNVSDIAWGGEQIIQDLLEKIPGISVEEDGTIKVGQQPIEKIMVEGDDFFGKEYTVLSKNMPAYPIGKIEVLRNYSEDHLLHDIKPGEGIALNVRLKDNYKRTWFGNAEVGVDPFSPERYELKSDVMNFGKKDKFYFTVNANAIGYEPVGAGGDPSFHIGDGLFSDVPNSFRIVDLQHFNDVGSRSRNKFNQARMASLNAILRPSANWRVRLTGRVDVDDVTYSRYSRELILLRDRNIERRDRTQVDNRYWFGSGEIDAHYDISGSRGFQVYTRYGLREGEGFRYVSGVESVEETLKSRDYRVEQYFRFLSRLDDYRVIELVAKVLLDEVSQNYQVDYCQEAEDRIGSIFRPNGQISTHNVQWGGLVGRYLFRFLPRHLFDFRVGSSLRRDWLRTHVEPDMEVFTHNDRIVSYDQYASNEYQYDWRWFKLTGRLRVNIRGNIFDYVPRTSTEWSLSMDRGLNLEWRLDQEKRLNVGYSYASRGLGIEDLHRNYVFHDYRNVSRGIGEPESAGFRTWVLSYQQGSLGGNYLLNTLIYLVQYPSSISRHYQVFPSYTLSDRIRVDKVGFFNIHSTIDYFVERFSSNIKLDFRVSRSLNKNRINYAPIGRSISLMNEVGFAFRSGFKGGFNFHVGTRLDQAWFLTPEDQKIQSLSSESYVDLFFNLTQFIQIDFKSEWYLSYEKGRLGSRSRFVDIEMSFEVIPNKLTVFLIGKNLLDVRESRRETLGDLGYSMVSHKLVPRFVLGKVSWRF